MSQATVGAEAAAEEVEAAHSEADKPCEEVSAHRPKKL